MKQTKRRTFWFLLGIASVVSLQVMIAAATGAAGAGNEQTRTARITEENQTIWELARAEFPDKDTRRMVYEIKQLNKEIDFGSVKIGQAVKLPAGRD